MPTFADTTGQARGGGDLPTPCLADKSLWHVDVNMIALILGVWINMVSVSLDQGHLPFVTMIWN